jgi:hypothetical protein
MQTVLQFGNSSTIQEWSNFKGLLKSKTCTILMQNSEGPADLIDHLTKQLQGASVIKKWNMRTESFEGGFKRK